MGRFAGRIRGGVVAVAVVAATIAGQGSAVAAPAAVGAPTLAGPAAWSEPAERATPAEQQVSVTNPTVAVDAGRLRGFSADGVDGFLGVPYAKPPVAELRWRQPQPPQHWSGVRDALTLGDRCAALSSTNGPRSQSEDCLYLNVWRPAGVRPGRRLPVYLWIHGGGLLNGSSNQHDGTMIARRAGVVVVSVNYRLGAFGFLAHPALAAQDGQVGDYGLLDQQAAMAWVHRNIAAFGGDPAQVTLGGESAGGYSVCAHLTAPGSRGLFSKAIIASAPCHSQPVAEGEAIGVKLANDLGCPDLATAAACLRAIDPGALLDGAASYDPLLVGGVPALPTDVAEAIAAGRFARVPLIIGANRDEQRSGAKDYIGESADGYREAVRQAVAQWWPNVEGLTETVLARYPWPADADQFTPAYLLAAIGSDAGKMNIGGCATRRLSATFARYTKTFAYQFDHRTGPGLTPDPVGFVWGAGHAAELAYMWPSFDNGTPIAPTFTPAERRLSADMVGYWGSFIRTGRPGVPDAARWIGDPGRNGVLSLRAGGTSTMISNAELGAEHNCDLWDALA